MTENNYPPADVIHVQNKFLTHFVHRSPAGWYWCGKDRMTIHEVTLPEIETIIKMTRLKMLETRKATPIW